jgi:hypothetical protein
MNEMLQELIGKRVEVWPRGIEVDEQGTLEGVDESWLWVRNTEGHRWWMSRPVVIRPPKRRRTGAARSPGRFHGPRR